jgi:hypothetical protein
MVPGDMGFADNAKLIVYFSVPKRRMGRFPGLRSRLNAGKLGCTKTNPSQLPSGIVSKP